jgi:DNA-binding HxlR family transcriptional regulator
MKIYGQFCPVALAAEVLCERWTLLVVRELLSGSRRFSEIQRGVPLMSRSMLAQRLRALHEAGILERTDEGYELTEAGEELRPIVFSFGEWGKRWVRHPLRKADVDLNLLMWDMRRRVDTDAIPEEPVLVEFEFRGVSNRPSRYWLHLKPEEVDLCLNYPGFDVDVKVETDPVTIAEVWMGDVEWKQAIRAGAVKLHGERGLVREFPCWLQRSVFAESE